MTLLFATESKTVPITRNMVQEAYQKVKSNQGSAGVDKESLSMYERDLSRNLYKLWNRLASGSYIPQAVKEVEIPKTNGGKRKLGIPTVERPNRPTSNQDVLRTAFRGDISRKFVWLSPHEECPSSYQSSTK
jgi:hypothetical protein